MSTPYSVAIALQSLLREKWINLLSVLTIASGLSIISIAILAAYNIDAATRNLPERFSMVLYLDDGAGRETVDDAIAQLRKMGPIKAVRHIPKEEALGEMKSVLKGSAYVLEGLDENPLPDTLEVKLRKEAVGPETVRKLAQDARRIKGIKEVDYGEKFLAALHSLMVGVQVVGLLIVAVLSIGIVFVCYSTVKILFYRRTEEVETFKLLGATKGFIRAPFLIEGAVIGGAGGLLSLSGIFGFYYAVVVKFSPSVPFLKAVLFPADLFSLLPLAGVFLGVTGAAIALGRLKY